MSEVPARGRAPMDEQTSETRYRTLFDSIDEGFCIVEVLFDADGNACDVEFLEVNPAFARHAGFAPVPGQRMREIVPNRDPQMFEIYGAVVRTGRPRRFTRESKDVGRWFEIFAFPFDAARPNHVATLFTDVTERVHRERNAALLAELDRQFAQSMEPDGIMTFAGDAIRRHLGVASVSFTEVDPDDNDSAVVIRELRAGDSIILGPHRFSDYLDPEYFEALRSGRTIAVEDVEADARTSAFATAYRRYGVRAQIHAPYLRDGRWRFLLAVHHDAPRAWRADEVSLLQEACGRIWLRLERARAERAHRIAEERYRSLFHSIDQGFCIIEVLFDGVGRPRDYLWLEVNPAWERQTGLPNPVGRTALELIPDLDESWIRIYGEVAQTGASYRFESHVAALRRWFDVLSFRIGDPGEARVAVLFKDVTASKLEASDLRRSEALFRRMADTAPAMLWVVNRELATTYMSRGWYEYTGLPTDQETPGPDVWSQCIHPDDRDAAISSLARAAEQRRPFSIDYRLRHADGRYRWVSDTGHPQFDGTGAWLGYIGSITDVHERKLAEEALRAADRRKDEFIATLAHELRNPLAPLRNGIDLLRMNPDGVNLGRVRDLMDRQVSHLTRLVDDLLEVSRITRGRIELQRRRVDLASIVESALESSRPAVEAGGHTLSVVLPPEPVELLADAVRLSQVIANLLNNAARYTDPGGRIRLEATAEPSTVVVRVIDDGIGLAPEDFSRIFEMFTQAGTPASGSREGLGIGLSLAQSLVRQHGGEVEARSPGIGHGSEFIVRLPRAPAADGGPPPGEGPPQTAATAGIRILIADDNRDAAEALATLLTMTGAQTRVVHDGLAALVAFDEYAPRAVLLDIGMPGMDGYEVARRLRARAPDTILIALTGWGQEADRRRAHGAGFDHHLLKPVTADTLHRTLCAALAARAVDSATVE